MDEHMEYIEDSEIQEKVESLVGKGTKVVDCKKSTSFETQEILLVNGHPIPLHGDEGLKIKEALLEGQVPSGDILNEILIRAGILTAPIELETTMNVKSTKKFTELLTFRDKNGILIDERMKETEEDNEFNGTSTERWKKENVTSEDQLKSLSKRVDKVHQGSVTDQTHILDGQVSPRLLSDGKAPSPTSSSSSSSSYSSSQTSSSANGHCNGNVFNGLNGVNGESQKPSIIQIPRHSSEAVESRDKLFSAPQFFKANSNHHHHRLANGNGDSGSGKTTISQFNSNRIYNSKTGPADPNNLTALDYMSSLQAEINKVPVRVSYETFV